MYLFLTNTDLGKIKDLKDDIFTHKIIPMVFPVKEGKEGLEAAIDKMLADAEKAVDDEKNYIILSDRNISEDYGSNSFITGCCCSSSPPY
jgi:glutamate synthase (NADPH) large chain